MKQTKRQPTFFASCPRGLEELLANEANNLNLQPEVTRGGISFDCSNQEAISFLLQTRLASRVYRVIQTINFKNQADLFSKLQEKWWYKEFDLEQTFKVDVLLSRDAQDDFKNSLFLAQKIKDVIVDQFREKYERRPSVELKHPDISFLVHIQKQNNNFKAIVSVDLCGDPLSNRGYREKNHRAPLRENLAAALVLATDWKKDENFIDPMCGSGTILIEAMMIRLDLFPSYLKVRQLIEKRSNPYSFVRHKWFLKNPELPPFFQKEVERIYNTSLEKLNSSDKKQFFANDHSFESIALTKQNIRNAFLPLDCIQFSQTDATHLLPPCQAPGVVLLNPPYGERLGEDQEELEELYHEIGENLKENYQGFRAYIFTGNLELRKSIGLQTSARIPFYNGNIECRLLRYNLY